MTLHLHALKGCSPVPLANYLKALGILRLVVEQRADPDARGWWQDEHFCLLSNLGRSYGCWNRNWVVLRCWVVR